MSELSQAIEEMRNMRESYDQIAGSAEAYNVGKTQLAQAITSKGVETSPTETYPEMAEKVNAISQETYEINGGEMYAKQLFGSLTTPNYWNLYEVLAQLLSDGRLVDYGGILLAEYYKGYASLALSGAGAGGAYVVSDKDSDGNFTMYTNDTTHTWNTEDDGRGNRWVAYCFADEYHDFQITDTNTSPRSIFIGRKAGTITSLVDGRTSQIVVPDGNELKSLNTGEYTQNFGKNIVLRNIKEASGNVLFGAANSELLYAEIATLKNGALLFGLKSDVAHNLNTLILKTNKIDTGNCYLFSYVYNVSNQYLTNIIIADIQECSGVLKFDNGVSNGAYMNATNLKGVMFIDIEELNYMQSRLSSSKFPNFHHIYIGYKINNKGKSVSISENNLSDVKITDLELRNGWCKPLIANTLSALTEENMYAHILQRLKQDEPDCGDGVTITLGSTNLAKLTSVESVQLLDDLTNIYGYTFA